jgi:LuxR family maltose regulon positive regulatory protein
MFSDGDLHALVALIQGIGADVAIRDGFLATMLAYAGVMTGDIVCAERWCAGAARFYAAHRFASADEEVAYFTMRAHLAPDGWAVMADDAGRALSVAEESSPWRVPALQMAGVAAVLRGDDGTARALLQEAVHRSRETGIRPALILTLAELVLASTNAGKLDDVGRDLAAAEAAIGDDMREYPHSSLVWALAALHRQRAGDEVDARAAFTTAMTLRPIAGRTMPWLGIQLRTVLARAAVGFGDVEVARALVGEARVLLDGLGDAAGLGRDVDAIARAVAPLPSGHAVVALLTAAELRVLPLLSTHLSFDEIGRSLFVSRHTVKSQAISIYRKLGVRTRSDAVAHARDLGLLAS